MRVFFLSLFLLYTVSGNAVTADCNLEETECRTAAGCHWENGDCSRCSENHFCTGYNNQQRPCGEDDNFEFSFSGSTSIYDCYKPITDGNTCLASDGTTTQNCGLFYPNETPKCLNDDGTYTEGYHIDSNNLHCYANDIPCRIFDSDNCPTDKISGTAIWFPNDEEWDIQNCKCTELPFTDSTDKFCSGIIKNVGYSTPRWRNYVQQISYTGTAGAYYCTQCNTGYYVNHSTDMEANVDDDDCENDAVCKCTIIPKGKYLEQACTQPLVPPITNSNQDICPPHSCGAGKTTDNAGTIGNTCHYTPDTKFCDAKGCFNITDATIGGWDWGL